MKDKFIFSCLLYDFFIFISFLSPKYIYMILYNNSHSIKSSIYIYIVLNATLYENVIFILKKKNY